MWAVNTSLGTEPCKITEGVRHARFLDNWVT